MHTDKLTNLAEELENQATTEELFLKSLSKQKLYKPDPIIQNKIVHLINLQRWAKTIREFLASYDNSGGPGGI